MRRFGKAYKRRGQVEAGRMNKTEQAYARFLEQRKLAGEIVEYKFEDVKLRLAKRTFYTPDFLVHRDEDDVLEIHEVKGHWEDDAKVKIKTAAKEYPMFKFMAFKKGPRNGPAWIQEDYEGA